MRCADVAVEAGALGEGAAAGGAPVHLQVLVHSPVKQGGVVALVRADYTQQCRKNGTRQKGKTLIKKKLQIPPRAVTFRLGCWFTKYSKKIN